MRAFFLSIAPALLALSHASDSADSNIDVDQGDLQLVIVGMRHGYRAPCTFLQDPDTVRKLAGEEECMLIDIGKQQAFGMGGFVKQRYGNFLAKDGKLTDAVMPYHSSAARARDTLLWFLRGLENDAPGDFGDSPNNSAIAAYDIKQDDPMLRAYKLKPCPVNTNGWSAVERMNLTFIQEAIKKNKDLLDYATSNTNVNASDYNKLGGVADNIAIFRDMKLGQPDWVGNPSLSGMSGEDVRDGLIAFQDAAQFACAKHPPCRNAMAGYWLWRVLELLTGKAAGGMGATKLVVMTSHSETTLSLMRLLGFPNERLDFSDGFILEMRKQKAVSEVRFLFHRANLASESHFERELHNIVIPDCGHWCPLSTFTALNRPKSIRDLEALCKTGTTHACLANQTFTRCGPSDGCALTCEIKNKPASCSAACGDEACVCAAGLVRDGADNCHSRARVCGGAGGQRDQANRATGLYGSLAALFMFVGLALSA